MEIDSNISALLQLYFGSIAALFLTPGSIALGAIAIIYIAFGFRLSSRAIPGPFWSPPLIGENIDFLTCHSPASFFLTRLKRYSHGAYSNNPAKLVRSYLFGTEVVLVGDIDHWKSLNGIEPDTIKWGLPFEAINKLVNLKSSSEPDLHQYFRKHMTASLSLTNLRSVPWP